MNDSMDIKECETCKELMLSLFGFEYLTCACGKIIKREENEDE